MRILIINGPSLNLLGVREPEIYGHNTYLDLESTLNRFAKENKLELDIHQTNYEGIVIDLLQHAHHKNYDAVLLNAAALSHYSYAIYDAIKSIRIPVIEVHLTNPKNRPETFRHISVIEPVCIKTFSGEGFNSYINALRYLLEAKS